jgi:predicted CoA-substrate-specific enzyme activase
MKIPFFCSYIPAALLEALGHEVADISLFTEETCGLEYSCALHDNLCSYAKYLFRKILTDGKRFDMAVIPNTCDAMKKLYAALNGSGRMPAFLLDVPRRSGREGAVYLAAQYQSLLSAIAPGLDTGELLMRLSARSPSRTSPLDGTSGDEATWPLKIGIAGSSYAPSFFRTTLSRYRAGAVFLRHCGYGMVPAPPEEVASSLEEQLFLMARNTLQKTLCPRSDRGKMADFLLAEMGVRKLAGLIFTSLKFCDFYAFEWERIRKRLPPDFPLLSLESDLSVGNDEQNRTRIEAFMEKIRSGMKGEERPRSPSSSKSRVGMVMGLDIGSAATKGILLKDGGEILASVIRPTSINMKDGAQEVISALLLEGRMNRRDVSRIVLTGYGRTAFPEMEQITEITCHALGVHYLRSAGATIIDVGGQDSKSIRIDAEGRVLRFAMNDKCAAGTGRFLESMVKRMNITFDEFSALSMAASEATPISSMCSVFAESEVVSLMARGVPAANIARGLNAAVAARVRGLVGKIQGEAPFVLTGGMAQNPGFIRELETALASPVAVFRESPLAGAIGAALAIP